MWIGDYQRGRDLALAHTSVDALLAAALLRSDASHRARLSLAFPALAREVAEREDGPGGALCMEEWRACHGEPDEGTRLFLEQRFPRSAA